MLPGSANLGPAELQRYSLTKEVAFMLQYDRTFTQVPWTGRDVRLRLGDPALMSGSAAAAVCAERHCQITAS